jgi:hypothetical protein
VREPTYCETSECENETEEGRRYCFRCWKREQRGQDRHAPVKEVLTPWARVVESAIDMVDRRLDDDDDANDRLERNFKRDVENWMRSRGWQPPGSSARAQRPPQPHVARRRTPPPQPVRTQLELPLQVER